MSKLCNEAVASVASQINMKDEGLHLRDLIPERSERSTSGQLTVQALRPQDKLQIQERMLNITNKEKKLVANIGNFLPEEIQLQAFFLFFLKSAILCVRKVRRNY